MSGPIQIIHNECFDPENSDPYEEANLVQNERIVDELEDYLKRLKEENLEELLAESPIFRVVVQSWRNFLDAHTADYEECNRKMQFRLISTPRSAEVTVVFDNHVICKMQSRGFELE